MTPDELFKRLDSLQIAAADDTIKQLRAQLVEAETREAANRLAFEPSLRRLREERDEWKARTERAEAIAYVPGLRRCAKCGCNLMTTTIHVPSGAMSSDLNPKDCPNGCGPMWPVTERQTANESIAREDKLRGLIKDAEWGREGQCIWCLVIEGSLHDEVCPAFTPAGAVK
jgi:hypothetical protein